MADTTITIEQQVTQATISVDIDGTERIVEVQIPEPSVNIVAGDAPGPPGPPGKDGDQRFFVQPEEPDFGGNTGAWVQTGLAGGVMTLWIEDGQ